MAKHSKIFSKGIEELKRIAELQKKLHKSELQKNLQKVLMNEVGCNIY